MKSGGGDTDHQEVLKRRAMQKKQWLDSVAPVRRKIRIRNTYGRWFWIMLGLYVAYSAFFFRHMNHAQPGEYMDEIFHGPQTRKFCNGTFDEWDPKITTLPGTYLLAAGILRFGSALWLFPEKAEELCSIINLRTYNFFLSIANFFLIHELNYRTQMTYQKDGVLLALTTLNSAFFPVLYFFSFMYYTDVTSLTFLLLMHLLFLRKKFFWSAVIGAFSVVVRQTNIVWIVFHGMLRTMDVWADINHKITIIAKRSVTDETTCTQTSRKTKTSRQEPEKDTYRNFYLSTIKLLALYNRTPDKRKLINLTYDTIKNEIFTNRSYLSVGWYVLDTMGFVIFVIYNRGVAVGDKDAHKVTINLVQMGYYTLMFAAFASPFLVCRLVRSVKKFTRNYKQIYLILTVVFAIVVYFNTVVHPYILADNRHVTFYLWNRVFGRYEIARYLLIPLYVWVWLFIWDNVDVSVNYRCILIICCLVNFTPQLLLEFRYFIFPYILMRSTIEKPKTLEIFLELFLILVINITVINFYINFPFTWEGTPGYQRFMW